MEQRCEVLHGTLILLPLRTLDALGPRAWVSEWGASEKNRKAKLYSITPSGRRRLAKETEDWRRMSSTIERLLAPSIQEGRG